MINDFEGLKCIVAVSPKYETFFVLGFINFLGLIYFLEKVPKPLISTLSSRATASTIESNIESIADVICDFVKFENSFLRDFSISERVKVSLFLLIHSSFKDILSLSASTAKTTHSSLSPFLNCSSASFGSSSSEISDK